MSTGTALIDADVLAYRFAYACSDEFDWGGGVTSRVDDLPAAKLQLAEHVEWILEATGCRGVFMCLSDHTSNWRNAIYPPYKQNRENDRKERERPPLWDPLREFLADEWPCFQRPTLEADDVLGILATSRRVIQGRKVIVSIDKDLQQIPGELFNPNVKEGRDPEIQRITAAEAEYQHMLQTLTGDATDGYPGCPGIGPKRAARLLVEADEYWPCVVAAYERKGLTEADALVQAQVARICRREDYDFRKKEVRLWTPKR